MGHNSDRSWFDAYLNDFMTFFRLYGSFDYFLFLKIPKSFLESTLNFIKGHNSDKSWFDAYLIDFIAFLDLRGLFELFF